MQRSVWTVVLPLLLAGSGDVLAQARVMAPQPTKAQRFGIDILARQEWTKDYLGDVPDDSRWLLRARPRLEFGNNVISGGVGGDFIYGSEDNTKVSNGVDIGATTIADNYDSRSARLDLAFLRLQASSWLHIQGGLFEMELPLTEMIWDHDLRAQGGMAGIEFHATEDATALQLMGLYTNGSHPFGDTGTSMVAVMGTATFASGMTSSLRLGGGYVQFGGLDNLDTRLYRENAALDGKLVDDYRVADGQLRLRSEGSMPLEVYGDYCWNTALKEGNRGLWAGVILGSLQASRARMEYTYARIDSNATLGAYNSDDFLWSTGVEAHRAEVATTSGRRSSLHLIAQIQRPKDATDQELAKHWVRRFRIEIQVRPF